MTLAFGFDTGWLLTYINRIVCTGHSMGAGVAAVLTVILRQSIALQHQVRFATKAEFPGWDTDIGFGIGIGTLQL